MDRRPNPEQDTQLYVLESNVRHLSTLLATEQDAEKIGVLRALLNSAEQDLHQFRSSARPS